MENKKIDFLGKLHILAILLVIFAAAMIWRGDGQDIAFHGARIRAIADEMKNGPGIYRIYTTMCDGYGYASPLFYGDIFLYPFAFLVACGLELSLAFRLLLLSVIATSYAAMYACVKEVWGKQTAELAAFLYAFSPILLTDVFIRYSIGEAMAFPFFPLVFLGFYRVVVEPRNRKWDWMYLALGMSGLILTHIISTVLVLILLVALCICHVKKMWSDKWKICSLVAAALLTVGITAFFTFPMLEQMASARFLVTSRGNGNLAQNVVPLAGLFFGKEYISLINLVLEKLTGTADRIVLGWFPGAIGYLLFFVLYVRVRKREWMKEQRVDRLLGISIFYLLLSMVPWIWYVLEKVVGFIQFPWRNLVLYTVFLSLCAAAVLTRLREHGEEKLYRTGTLSGIFGAAVVIAGLAMLWVHNGTFSFEQMGTNTIGLGEYLPAAAGSYDYSLKRGEEVICSDDGVTFEFRRRDGYSELVYSDAEDEVTFEVPVYMYLGYDVVDEETGISYTPVTSENGLVEFTVAGATLGTVKIYYKGTALQKISLWISFVTVAALAIWGVYQKCKMRGKGCNGI